MFRKQLSDAALEILKGTVLDAVVAVDSHGKIVAWNTLAERTFGWSEEEASGRYLHDLIIPQRHRSAHSAGMARFLETGAAMVVGRRIEISAVNREGHEFPVELSIVMAPEGGEATFIGFIRDITERVEGQSRLAISEESLRLATEAAEVGTWDLDLTSNVLTWSDRTKAMFGISPGAPCSMDDFYGGLHPDDLEQTSLAFESTLDPNRRDVYDVIYRTIGKEDHKVRWIAAKGKGLFNEKAECVRAVGTAIDITQSKIEEGRNAILQQLNELLSSTDANAALHTACALMGGHFAVSRTGYGQLDRAEDAFKYTVCWTDGHVPPLLGTYPASAFRANVIERLEKGETVVVDDLFANAKDEAPRSRDMAREIDTRAILVVPFLRGGRLRTVVYLNSRNPRTWQADEVAFMEAVARRTQHLIDKAEAEAVIAAKDAQFSAIAQAMPNHAWMANPEGLLFWFNDQVYSYTGYGRGQLDGDEWQKVIQADDRADAAGSWLAALQTGPTYQTQFRILRADGEYRWHLVRAVPIRDLAGEIISWVGTNTDVHDQKLANETLEAAVDQRTAALVDSERRFRAIFDSAFQLTGLGTLDGSIILVNQAALDAIHATQDMVAGLKVWDAPWWAHSEYEQERVKGAVVRAAAGEFVRYDASVLLPIGHRTFDFSIKPVFDQGRPAYLLAEARDITDQRLAEEGLRQAQKMEAVGQLTGGIAHDFNNLLQGVNGSLELIRRRPDDRDKVAAWAESGIKATQRGVRLTAQLLAFSRAQKLEVKAVVVDKTIVGMGELLERTLGSTIRVRLELGSEMASALTDEVQLEMALLNLAINARDAMPQGGDLTLSSKLITTADSRDSVEGDYIEIAVRDTGSGMPPDVLQRAFDPFFTTKPTGEGTGLGLSQVYGTMRQGGGSVAIESKVGVGTTVRLLLRRAETAPASEERPELTPPRLETAYSILIIDDDPDVRTFLCDCMEALGYASVAAEDGYAGIAAFDRARPDIVIVDFAMPGLNGAEVARQLRIRDHDIPIIFATAYYDTRAIEAVAGGDAIILHKPFQIAQLQALLAETLR